MDGRQEEMGGRDDERQHDRFSVGDRRMDDLVSQAPVRTDPGTPAVSQPGEQTHRTFEGRRDLMRRLALNSLLIAFGALSAVQGLGVALTLLTPVCLLLAPALLLMRATWAQWLPFALAVVGFVALYISSQINDTSPFEQRVIQWGAFALYYVGFLVVAERRVERAFSILCGIALGALMYYLTPGNPYAVFYTFADQWKYVWAQWIGILALYAMITIRARIELQIIALLLLGSFSLVENFRSHAIVCVFSAAILIVGLLARNNVPRWLQLGVVVFFGSILYVLLPRIALSGIAGEALQRKTQQQVDSGVPTILAGRTESPLSITAILERPWFGWGSANNISPDVFDKAKDLAISLGFNPTSPIEYSWYDTLGNVSLHSVLFSTWAEGGIFAALLPLGLLVAALAVLWNAPRYGRWAALAVLLSVQAVWDLLFSPVVYNMMPAYALLAVVFTAEHFSGGGVRSRRPGPL
ncbi:O-antigen ligase family protein [Mycobacterium sp. CPCC 205372]|uniref:O-antigen ligase family protein n=1 Tax=Mycobacterium hippophais TaxID=3016340 RepID=A0ABT4PRU0_9MYCO|nr:O-antigen ligase family protein [Mycobacterium hippophais]MCZ8379277.1 O-antigen ligase family protein [Mycobacterium hippophais]